MKFPYLLRNTARNTQTHAIAASDNARHTEEQNIQNTRWKQAEKEKKEEKGYPGSKRRNRKTAKGRRKGIEAAIG